MSNFQEAIFPIFCCNCNREGMVLCEECIPKLILQNVFCCPVCATVNNNGAPCAKCHEKSFLSAHGAFFVYQEQSLVARLIHELKYNFVEESVRAFEPALVSFYTSHPTFFQSVDVVVPVPLHPRRLAERGFNQSQLVANMFASHCGMRVEPLLKRHRFTRPQAQLSQADRITNVEGAFVASSECFGKHILLVDDVFTTGSTMQSCAQALLGKGAASVIACTVARGTGIVTK